MKPLMLLLFLSSSCFAQPAEPPPSKAACKTAFAVARRSTDDSDLVVALSKQQSDWWEKKGAKKYPDLCLVFEDDADYLLVWEDRITRNVSEPHNDPQKDRSEAHTGVGMSREDPHHIPDTVVQEVGSVWIYRRATGQDGKQTWQPIEYKESARDATGWFATDIIISGSPTRKAMESALKFIRKRP
jgi:hypothetical protein